MMPIKSDNYFDNLFGSFALNDPQSHPFEKSSAKPIRYFHRH